MSGRTIEEEGSHMRVLLELSRIVLVFFFLAAVGVLLLERLYHTFPTAAEGLGLLGVFLLIFLLYRHKLQFTGWYHGKKRTPIRKKTILLPSLLSFLCIVFPFLLHLYLKIPPFIEQKEGILFRERLLR